MKTTTLYKYIQSELIERGFNEFENAQGELVFFNKDYQFMQKIVSYDSDIQEIVNELFYGLSLDDITNDNHFKKTFILRFINRQINRQTIESFQLELMNTFLTNQVFLNQVYTNLEQYITGTAQSNQQNQQVNDGQTLSDNRQAFADLPQNQVNIDVNDSVMKSATDNTISRNKQTNNQSTDGTTTTESKSYQLDQLLQSNQLMEQVFNLFDVKCFLQVF